MAVLAVSKSPLDNRLKEEKGRERDVGSQMREEIEDRRIKRFIRWFI